MMPCAATGRKLRKQSSHDRNVMSPHKLSSSEVGFSQGFRHQDGELIREGCLCFVYRFKQPFFGSLGFSF